MAWAKAAVRSTAPASQTHSESECSDRPWEQPPQRGRRKGMSRRQTMLGNYLVLAIMAGLLHVGRPQQPVCETVEAVNLPPNPGEPSVKLVPNNPGRFFTRNYDSPDTTIRWVLEYSEEADFSNLKPLDLSRPVFDSTLSIDPSGEDIDLEFDGVTGSVNSGRFVFAKVDPNDEFKFPRTKMLENGNFYFFKNYKVRDGCVSPPIDLHAKYPSEVLTRPSSLQSQGLPSAVRNIRHVNLNSSRISIQWDYPLDSGNNRPIFRLDSKGLNLSYVTSAQPVAGDDGSYAVGAVQSTINNSISEILDITPLQQGQLYRLLVKSQTVMGFSSETELLGRPVGPPAKPRDFTFQINPFNLTNATGNRYGLVTWREPLDTGLGVPCHLAPWTACGKYPLKVVAYNLRRVLEGVEAAIPLDGSESTSKGLNVSLERSKYKFKVNARNQQQSVLGNFSAVGDDAETTTLSGLLSGKPLQMRLLYFPWAKNSSMTVAEAVVTPPHARGVSDYCFKTNQNGSVRVGREACPASDEEADSGWVLPADCDKCVDMDLAVFVNAMYTFKVRAVKEDDIDFTEYDPDEIRMEHNLATALGPNWENVVSLNYSVFRCGQKTANQHWTDQEACDRVNKSYAENQLFYGKTQQGYGWKEIIVSFTPDLATAAEMSINGATKMCFAGITPSNKRSQMCIDVRIIRPDPQFVEFKLQHDVTMGCRFSTELTAEDRTEIGISRQTALEKNYLVGISSIGGRLESRYRSRPFPALPDGARLFPAGLTMATNNSITYRFEWTPKRFQEGFTYIVDLEARGYLGDIRMRGMEGSPLTRISLTINVLRCRFCIENQDHISLSTLASEWRASWLSIWSGNHVLVDVDTVEETTVQLGPVFKVASAQGCDRATLGDMCNDDLAHIGNRYGVTIDELLWWNPDLSDEAGRKNSYQLYQDQEICVLPSTCVSPGHIYSGGF